MKVVECCGSMTVVDGFPPGNAFAVFVKMMERLLFLQLMYGIKRLSSEDWDSLNDAGPHLSRCSMLQALWDAVIFS